MEHHELTSTVGEIYEAALDSSRWVDALRSSVKFVGGQRGMVGITNTSTGVLDVAETYELDPEMMGRWARDYGREDPWAESMVDMFEGQVGRGSDLASYETLEKNPTFREIVVPLGVYDTCWTALASNRIQKGFLSAFQGKDRGPFSIGCLDRMTALSPHLVRSARVHSQLAELRARTETLESAVNALSFALLSCTADARIVTLNRCADDLLSDGGPLQLQRGTIACRQAEQTRRLQDLIAAASATATGESSRGGGVVALRGGGSMEGPLIATVVPLSSRAESTLPTSTRGHATALITITHPGQSIRIPRGALNEIFGLTPAEAQLALNLAQGSSIAEYALQTGVSLGTVRWTLKNVQSKMGVGRQAEVVALINRSLAPLIDGGPT